MTYATLTVRLELGNWNTGLLRIAGDLAEDFHAGVIGIAAWQARRRTEMPAAKGVELAIERDNLARDKLGTRW